MNKVDTKKVLLIILFCLVKSIHEITAECILKLSEDFAIPSPILLKNKNFLTPNTGKDVVKLSRKQIINVACNGKNNAILLRNVTTRNQVTKAMCLSNTTFQVNTWKGSFKDIRCSKSVTVDTIPSNTVCHERSTLYRIGYRVNKVFYDVYEACFNVDLLQTNYVKHTLNANNRYIQPGKRPTFFADSLFHKININKVYKLSNQKSILNSLLGAGKEKEYLTKKQFLSRGHLAARADFPLRAMQRASFHYVNTAPQWQRGNAGDWAALEEALRRRVHTLNTTVIVYTGTEGVSTLRSAHGHDTPIYLYRDENNNQLVPVPMYFYKLVYDPKKKAATAFVSINSSYHNQSSTDRLTFCNDICDGNPNFSWLTWRNDDTHSFCCSYEEFVQKISYLSKLNVCRMFYYVNCFIYEKTSMLIHIC